MTNATAKLTYDAIGNREDLSNVISNISPVDTPFLSRFGKEKANATYHEWLTDSLANAAANAKIEGYDYSFSKVASRTRVGNYTQIFQTSVEVSDTQRAVDTAGIEDEFAYQMAKKMKEHARDIEYALVNGTGNSGASGTARTLKGVLSFMTTNVETGTGTGDEDLISSMFDDLLQTIWAAGGMPDYAYANGYQKRQISAFTAGNTRNIGAAEKEVVAGVDIYDSDFGRIKIIPHRYMTTSVVAVLQNDLWKVATLRPTKKIDVAKIGSATRAVIETELTLVSKNEAGSGQITGLSLS
ncbi:MAG: DUF5309 domain-containing protein [Ignavibacteriales bacterium]